MKKIILCALLSLIISFLTAKESLPEYRIKKSAPDSSIKKTESAFDFTFLEGVENKVKKPVMMTYNGTPLVARMDGVGKYFLKVKPGKYKFMFFLDKFHTEIKTDSIEIKPGYRTEMEVIFASTYTVTVVDKPVIYFYPPETKTVSVKLDLKGKLGFTYPEYNNGWNFTADADGTIHVKEKKYHYLFWDATAPIYETSIDRNLGFVVDRKSLTGFFEEKLSQMGLNSKEIEDYITYWCPRMNVNEKNYIYFLFNKEFEQYASLSINPKPDNLFRVFMLWSAADDNMQVKDQKIRSFSRKGFTVVEWGGSEMPSLKN